MVKKLFMQIKLSFNILMMSSAKTPLRDFLTVIRFTHVYYWTGCTSKPIRRFWISFIFSSILIHTHGVYNLTETPDNKSLHRKHIKKVDLKSKFPFTIHILLELKLPISMKNSKLREKIRKNQN